MRRLKNFIARFEVSPRKLKSNMQEEDMYSRIRIVSIAVVMAGIAASYQKYLDNLILRSRRFQGGVENGNLALLLPSYVDPALRSEQVFKNKIQIDILETKDLKDLWMIAEGGVDRTYTQYFDRNVTEVDSNGNEVEGGNVYFVYADANGGNAFSLSPDAKWGDYLSYDSAANTYSPLTGEEVEYTIVKDSVSSPVGPNGPGYGDKLFYEQKERWANYKYAVDAYSLRLSPYRTLERYEEEYQHWLDMRSDVKYFDTSACIQGTEWQFRAGAGRIVGGMVGLANQAYFVPATNSSHYQPQSDWFQGMYGDDIVAYTYDEQQEIRTKEDGDPILRGNAIDFNLALGRANLAEAGGINYNDKNLYLDYLKDLNKLYEDCDLECQQKGSQLTTVAILLTAAFTAVMVNAIFMFFGAFIYGCRACSLCCTLTTCLFQLCIQIACAAMLYTPYTNLCARSLHITRNGLQRWTMADDVAMTRSIWGTGWVIMFGFLCCGLQSALKSSKSTSVSAMAPVSPMGLKENLE